MLEDNHYFSVNRLMPYTIASAWHRIELAITSAERVQQLISCLEILLRTLVAFLLPDYLRGQRSEIIDREIKNLSRPSLGTWVKFLRVLLQHLSIRTQPGAFMPEAQKWFLSENIKPTPPSVLLEELVKFRNKIVHDGPPRSEIHEKTRAETLHRKLHQVLRSMSWLAGYRPVRIRALNPTRQKTFIGKLQFFVGKEELNKPVDGEWDAFLLPDRLYLVNPGGDSLLELSPFMEIRTDARTHQEHCYLFKKITPNLQRLQRVHDASCLEIEEGVIEETGEVTLSEWMNKDETISLYQDNKDKTGTMSFSMRLPEINPGKILAGQYEVRKKLGSGDMATVYSVRDIFSREDLALKVLNANLSEEPIFRERFHREATTMTQFKHKYIVNIREVGQLEDGRPFYTLPIFPEGSLHTRVVKGGCPEEIVYKWAKQALSALNYLHAKGIIHRDVKPSNFLLDKKHDIKLADFGISLNLNETHRLTGVFERMGSREYMSPEQIQMRNITPKVDIYSLALVLHQLVTGEKARGKPGEQLQGKPGELIRWMGDIDPEQRPTAGEALKFLQAVKEDESPVQPTRVHVDHTGMEDIRLNLEKIENMGEWVEEISVICKTQRDNPDKMIELFSKFISESVDLLKSVEKSHKRKSSEESSEYAVLCSISHLSKKIESDFSSANFPTYGKVELKGLNTQLHKKVLLKTEKLLRRIHNQQESEFIPASSFFEDFVEPEPGNKNVDELDWYECILSGDEVNRYEAALALVGPGRENFLEELRQLKPKKKERLLEALWKMADIILLEGHNRAQGIFEAAIKFSEDKNLKAHWQHLYVLFTREGEDCWPPDIIRMQLRKYPEKQRRVFARALLIHPWAPYRKMAMELLKPLDFWYVASHKMTPINWVLDIWKHIKDSVTPNYKKIFFVCVRDNLLSSEGPQKILTVVELIKEFYSIDAFYEDVCFNMLLDLDDPLRKEAQRHGFWIDLDREYVELFESFQKTGPKPSHKVKGWGNVPLPVQRRLARRGYFLEHFFSHPLDIIALECLTHILKRKDPVEFVKNHSINSQLLHELGKEQDLFLGDDARFALVSNPKTHTNVVLNHMNFLKFHHLRKLAQSKDSNPLAQDIAKKILSRRKR